MPGTTTTHIHLDAQGRAWIDDTNVKVVEVALDKLAHEWTPEEIQRHHPGLTLAQIHAALSYYYDHQAALDQEIARQLETVEVLRTKSGAQDLAAKLRLRAASKGP